MYDKGNGAIIGGLCTWDPVSFHKKPDGYVTSGRNRKCVNRQIIILDVDNPKPDFLERAKNYFAPQDTAWGYYTTFSATEGNPRYRLCSYLDRAVSNEEYKKIAELSQFSVIEIYNFCYENIMESIYKVGYIRTLKGYLNLFQRSILNEINDELIIDSLEVDIKYNKIIVKYYNSISKLISMLKNNILDKDYETKIMIGLLVLYNSFIEDKEKYYKVRNEISLEDKKDIDYNFYDCNKYLSKSLKR